MSDLELIIRIAAFTARLRLVLLLFAHGLITAAIAMRPFCSWASPPMCWRRWWRQDGSGYGSLCQ